LAPEAVQHPRLVGISVRTRITSALVPCLLRVGALLVQADAAILSVVALFAKKTLLIVEVMLLDRTEFMYPLPVPPANTLVLEGSVPQKIKLPRLANAQLGESFGMVLLAKIQRHLEFIRRWVELFSNLGQRWVTVKRPGSVMTIVKQILADVADLIRVRPAHPILIFLMYITHPEPKLSLKPKLSTEIVTARVLVTIIVNLIRANAKGLILQLRDLWTHMFLVLITLRLPSTLTLPHPLPLITLLQSITRLLPEVITQHLVTILREVTILRPTIPLIVAQVILPRLITRRELTM